MRRRVRERERLLLYAVTTPMTARAFLVGQLAHFRERGWDVRLLSSPGPDLIETARREGVVGHSLPMRRSLSPLQDLRSLARWIRVMRILRPLVINVGTPKAALLAGVAGWATGVPGRLYVMHGLRLEGATGVERVVLWAMEWLACRSAHQVICVSPSLRERVVAMRLCGAAKARVLGQGSSNGVDVSRFAPDEDVLQRAETARVGLGIDCSTTVVGFVGRLTGDKGLAELMGMHQRLLAGDRDVALLVVGGIDPDDAPDAKLVSMLADLPRVHLVGQVPDVAPYYHLMHLVVLPTYREGYPNVILEAAAASRPAVSTDATGAIDAVVNGVTGVTVPVGNIDLLTVAVGQLIDDPDMRRRMGAAAARRVREHYAPRDIWDELDKVYRSLTEGCRPGAGGPADSASAAGK